MAEAKPMGRLARLLREPLLHFIVIGLALFAANAAINGRNDTPEDVIVISQGRIAQLAESFRAVSNRQPNDAEMKDMVDDFVMEEIAYREAVAMGLDADDTVDDVASVAEPTEAELQAWFKDHAADYAQPEKRALQQVLASRDTRGEGARTDAVRFMERLNKGANPASFGDASLLPAAVPLTTKAGLSALFGADFSEAVFAAEAGNWFGPVSSVFGEHVVRITDRAVTEAAVLEDVRDQVRNDLIGARRADIRRQDEQRLLERYEVRIDWPQASAPESKP
jgi:hypothetical protein